MDDLNFRTLMNTFFSIFFYDFCLDVCARCVFVCIVFAAYTETHINDINTIELIHCKAMKKSCLVKSSLTCSYTIHEGKDSTMDNMAKDDMK